MATRGFSACCTCWLLRHITRGPAKRFSHKLIFRQLFHLAVADLVAALHGTVDIFVQLELLPRGSTPFCVVWQYYLWAAFLYGLSVSVLVESHFALGLIASLRAERRRDRVRERLGRLLPGAWLLGAVVAAGDIWITMGRFYMDVDTCEWHEIEYSARGVMRLSSPLLAMLAAVLLLLNLLAYAAMALHCKCLGRRMVVLPGRHERRMRDEAVRFTLVAMLTWVPYWVIFASGGLPNLLWVWDGEQLVSASCIGLNGALNVWLYAARRQYILRRSEGDEAVDLDGSLASLNVRFADTVMTIETSSQGSPHVVPGDDAGGAPMLPPGAIVGTCELKVDSPLSRRELRELEAAAGAAFDDRGRVRAQLNAFGIG